MKCPKCGNIFMTRDNSGYYTCSTYCILCGRYIEKPEYTWQIFPAPFPHIGCKFLYIKIPFTIFPKNRIEIFYMCKECYEEVQWDKCDKVMNSVSKVLGLPAVELRDTDIFGLRI